MSENINSTNDLSPTQRMLAALKEARTKLEAVEQEKQERVAIVGMAGRFPGARNIDQFWHNLCNGINSIQFLSKETLQASGVDIDLINHPDYVNAYSSLDEIDGFDATFFGYSPREAEILDPQHRIFLECAWEALENAGYNPERYEGAIGVYAGAALNSYLINLSAHPELKHSVNRVQAVVSNVMGLMPTRVSYKLDLKGPSCGIQTGCSTSLVAVHLACQSLLNRECDVALAGGVSIDASNQPGYLYQNDGVLSPDGYCRAFDAAAKGTVFGNGVGIVVLKRLSQAIADQDCIYAVIRGSAINNDGAEKVGLTAPSVTGQATVIAAALTKAGISPETIQYIETHGTGTALGDPIEIAALTKVFRQHTQQRQFCAIGSVKTNIGHLDAAAGVTGLIKTALALKQRQIPPSLNFQAPNPQIDFEQSPFFVNTQLTAWQSHQPCRAAVSSFGMGGTNAHVILEEAPAIESPSESSSRAWHVLPLSAKTATALDATTTNLVAHLNQHPDLDLADVAYTLQTGRRAFEYRRVLVCQNVHEAIQILSNSNSQVSSNFVSPSSQRTIAVLFSGQGSQYVNMGRDLYETESLFQYHIDRCCEFLSPQLGYDLRDVLYPHEGQTKTSADQINLFPTFNDTALAQPALFILEYALAQLWLSWGIKPVAMLGHSIGEYVAATLAGVFSLEDALTVVATRGKLMQQCAAGAMLSVALSEAQVKHILDADLTLAAVNAPQLCVVSGTIAAIEAFEQRLTEQGIACRRLHVSHAFHSAMMEPILKAFVACVRGVKLHPPQLPLISNVTGTWMTTEQATNPHYWGQHLRQTVQFANGLAELLQKPDAILLEIGAGRTLSTFAKQAIAKSGDTTKALVLNSIRHPQEQASDVQFILSRLGHLWQAGIEINWFGLHQPQKRHRLPLPTYPFEHQRYWVEPQTVKLPQLRKQPDITNWFYLPSWQRSAPLARPKLEQTWSWLIFLDDAGVGRAIAEQLQQIGQLVTTVEAGNQFAQTESSYSLNPAHAEDYQRLLKSLESAGRIPQRIVHLWNLNQSSVSATDPILSTQNLGFYSLIALAQALSQPVQITAVTHHVQDVTGTETLEPLKATILSACKVISQEYPHLQCRTIDGIVSVTDYARFKEWINQLLSELTVAPTDLAVAYRDYHRWIQTFIPLALPNVNHQETILRQNGTYLIAGDLVAGLGLIFAQYLAETVNAKLILIGRANLPERSAWEKWLATHGQQDAVSRCLRILQGLEAQGTELHFFNANLTDAAKLRSIMMQCQLFEQIHGVFHAGTMGDQSSCLIQALDQTEMEHQFQTKVRGLITLAEVLQDKVTDFYLLQSSLSSVVGGVGFAAYAAANSFMDRLAIQQHRSGIPWISVNWDACRFDQSETVTGSALVDLAITPQEVWQVLNRVLSRPDLAQVIVSPTNLQTRIEQPSPQLFSRQSTIDSPQYSKLNSSTPYVAPRNPVEQTVAATMQDLLGIDPIGIYDNFFELGGHSLLAIQAVSRLRETFQVELPMREFLFESPTVAGIAKVISENQLNTQQAIADLLDQVEQMELNQTNIGMGEQ